VVLMADGRVADAGDPAEVLAEVAP
jgi:hypothetical protein